jgi:EpsI family protein
MNSERSQSASERLFPLLASLAFLLCYAGVIVSLVELWSTYALYSYGFAVPFIAGYLFWTRRATAPQFQRKPDYALGGPLIAAGLVMLVVGHAGTLLTIKQTSLLIVLAGLILVTYGREPLKFYRFTFAYLFLMVPIWDIPLNHLQNPSRLVSARIAAEFLQLIGVPVLRQDTNLVLPSVTLSVMPQCSGVNQLVVLIAMILPAAYLWLDSYPRRVAMFVFAIAVGYLSNGFRIALVGWLAVHGMGDGDVTASYAHLLEGLVVSALGYVAILAFLSLLSRSNRTAQESSAAVPPAAVYGAGSRKLLLDAVVLLMLIGAAVPLGASSDVMFGLDAQTLPRTIRNWTVRADTGTPEFLGVREDLVGAYPTAAGARRFVGLDDEVVRGYRHVNDASARLQLYIGYYRRQVEGRELTGDAGHVLEAAYTPLSIESSTGPLTLAEVVQDNGVTRRGIIFWYDIDGRVVENSYGIKAYTILNGIFRRRTNGAIVMVTWEGQSASTVDPHGEAIEFVKGLLPILRPHLSH